MENNLFKRLVLVGPAGGLRRDLEHRRSSWAGLGGGACSARSPPSEHRHRHPPLRTARRGAAEHRHGDRRGDRACDLLVREEMRTRQAEVTEKVGELVKGAVVAVAAGVFVLVALAVALEGLAWLIWWGARDR